MSEITITFTGQITSLVDYQGYFGGGDLAGKPWAAVWDFTLPPGTFNQVNGSPGTTSPSFFVLFAVSPDPHHGYGLTLGNNLGTNNVSSFSVHETPTSIDAQVSNPGVSGAEIAVSTSGPPFIQLPMGLFPIDYTVNPLTDTTSTNIRRQLQSELSPLLPWRLSHLDRRRRTTGPRRGGQARAPARASGRNCLAHIWPR